MHCATCNNDDKNPQGYLQSNTPKHSHLTKYLGFFDKVLVGLMASGLQWADHIFRTSMNMCLITQQFTQKCEFHTKPRQPDRKSRHIYGVLFR